MALNADQWRERGRHVRAQESLSRVPPATSREKARTVVRLAFASALAVLPDDQRETAVDHAAEGYLMEHIARGGTLA